MPSPTPHSWDLTPAEARALQGLLAPQVVRRDEVGEVRWIAAADVHYPEKGRARAVAVLFRHPELEVAEVQVVEEPASFPYVPGLLSFREAPAVARALERLTRPPDLLLVDGQGIAHPRRLGIAAHLGVLLGWPAIGCAKSRLCGEAVEPGREAGAWAPLREGEEEIGAVLRTRADVKPLYVSIGHRVDLPAAVRWTLATCRGRRVPEPLRLAHQLAGRAGSGPVPGHVAKVIPSGAKHLEGSGVPTLLKN